MDARARVWCIARAGGTEQRRPARCRQAHALLGQPASGRSTGRRAADPRRGRHGNGNTPGLPAPRTAPGRPGRD
eukprot:8557522-Lingulodinium_polyedra.AAC.1